MLYAAAAATTTAAAAPSPLLYPLNQANLQEWQGFLFRYSHTGGGILHTVHIQYAVQETQWRVRSRHGIQYTAQFTVHNTQCTGRDGSDSSGGDG